MGDRYALELLAKDIFSKCDSRDEVMNMYSDCVGIILQSAYIRNSDILEHKIKGDD